MTKKEVISLLLVCTIWRVVLFATSFLADRALSYEPSFPYAYTLLKEYGVPRWLYSWANFDGVHYLTIASKGYIGTGLIQAFFPVFPLLVMFVNLIIGNALVTGLVISNLAAMAVVLLLYYLSKLYFNRSVALISVITLLVFPTSFFLGAVYNESLFLAVTLGAFIAAKKKLWWLAALLAGTAAATRVVGVFVIFALALQLLLGEHPSKKDLSLKLLVNKVTSQLIPLIMLIGGTAGLAAYMYFLWNEFKDPLYFFHVQSEFGSGREESVILLPQVIWRYIKILSTVPFGLSWLTYLQELVAGTVPLLLVCVLWFKRRTVPVSWIVFSVAALLLPTLTGTFSSMPRYVLAAFPLLILLAAEFESRPFLKYLFILSGILLLFNTILFIQGYWIA